MNPQIGAMLADAASSALHGLGTASPAAVAMPPGWPAPALRLVSILPTIDLVLIKIELNFFGR
jgi:hypothetical protein